MTPEMSAESLEDHLRGLGYVVSNVEDPGGTPFTVVEHVEIPMGVLRGRFCDVAIQRINSIPFTVPAAIHTRPALLPMNPQQPIGTQSSPLGPDWQYWSRRFDHVPTPQAIWAHVLTVLSGAPG
jgi:hypothetical protein